jgi:hypothetical protein
MALQDEIDQKRREIHTQGYPMSVGELLSIYREGDLDIHPEFQRFFRWTPTQKSRFIESLLLGIPIPSIFVHQRQDGVWDVIDGLQRLSTIFEFVGDLKEADGTPVPAMALLATEYLPSLEGKAWDASEDDKGLSPDQQRLIKRAPIDIKIVTRESDEDAKFDLFQRLNTGGSQLSDQEVRNCLLIMVSAEFYRWVDALRQQEAFQEAIALSDRAQNEQYDAELALRFLALKDMDNEALRSIGDMSDFLDTRSIEFARDSTYDSEAEAESFTDLFSMLNEALGDDSFRRYDANTERFLGGFSVSAFEAITVGVHASFEDWLALDPEARKTSLLEKVQGLWQDAEFRSNSGSGIRASGRIPKTVPRGRELFRP